MRRLLAPFCVFLAMGMVQACSEKSDYDVSQRFIIRQSSRLHVSATASSGGSKSSFGLPGSDGYSSMWSGDETVGFMMGTSEVAVANSLKAGASTEFEPVFTGGAGDGVLRAFAPYYTGNYTDPEAAGFTRINLSTAANYGYVYLCMPSVQTPLTGSVDEGAHALVAKTSFGGGFPEHVDMEFEHAAAYGKMTLKDFDRSVEQLSITFPSNVVGTSFRYMLETGEFTNHTNSRNKPVVTLKADNVRDGVYWFGCIPNTVAVGQQLQIEVMDTGGRIYQKTVTISGRDLEFRRGRISSFSVSIPTPDGPSTDTETYSGVAYSGCYEMPAFAAADPESAYTRRGTYSSYGDYWLAADTESAGQTYVVHRFMYNGAVVRNLSMLFDSDKKCALWVSTLYNDGVCPDRNVGRNDAWGYDPALPTSVQPNLTKSYSGSYDRGHQVASNDRQTTKLQNNQTFYFSNMTPQYSTLNQGQWGQLENAVQTLGNRMSGRDTLYMVTGPIFDSLYSTTADADGTACPVPSAYYKCLMKCSFASDGTMTAASGVAYVTPGNNASANTSYSGWITTIDDVESRTGFDFFTNVPLELQNPAEGMRRSLF